jgi:hypothetical protein
VRLITAHRILIGSGIVFFLLYAGLRIRHYVDGGPASDLVQSLVAAAVAVGLFLYYRTLRGWGRPRS